jgi:hypothetical protein
VHPEIRTLHAVELWNRPAPGMLARGQQRAVIAACAISVIAMLVGEQTAWGKRGSGFLGYGLAVMLALWIAATFVPRTPNSRLMRVAVLLPLGHLIVLGFATALFAVYGRDLTRGAAHGVAVYRQLPMSVALGVVALAAIVIAIIAGRRRERLQALVTMALAQLLAFGLWLPIASAVAVGKRPMYWEYSDDHLPVEGAFGLFEWQNHDLVARPGLFVFVLAPAYVIGALITAIIMRRPAWARRHRAPALALLALATLVATAARIHADARALILHDAFVHVLLAAVVVAILALVVLGATLAVRRRPSDRSWCAGVIAEDEAGEVVGCLEIASWLRGPRALLRPCIVTTPLGDLPIHGAILDASATPLTSTLVVGEAAVVLRTGDRVFVGGLVEAAPDGSPFRTAAGLTPGPTTVIAPAHDRGGFAGMVLALWRPCVAYLVILTAIGIPALIAHLQ